MRQGFEGLYGLVRDRFSCEPLSGHLFLFCNVQRNRLKVLVWDGSGVWACTKRLEKGGFIWPQFGDAQGKVVLSHEELSLLLGGIDLTKTKHGQPQEQFPPRRVLRTLSRAENWLVGSENYSDNGCPFRSLDPERHFR
jgi:transposase